VTCMGSLGVWVLGFGLICEVVPRVKVCIEMLIRKVFFDSFSGFHLSINNYSVLDLSKT
jgi:hypothetical protein